MFCTLILAPLNLVNSSGNTIQNHKMNSMTKPVCAYCFLEASLNLCVDLSTILIDANLQIYVSVGFDKVVCKIYLRKEKLSCARGYLLN